MKESSKGSDSARMRRLESVAAESNADIVEARRCYDDARLAEFPVGDDSMSDMAVPEGAAAMCVETVGDLDLNELRFAGMETTDHIQVGDDRYQYRIIDEAGLNRPT